MEKNRNGDSILSTVIASAKIEDVLRLARVQPPANEKANIRCPLPEHEDSSASFHIQPSGKGYRCHGCGATGGVLDLVLRLGLAENKGKAVDLLAERYRIDKDGQLGTPSMDTIKPLDVQIKTYPAPEFTVEERKALTDSLKGGRPLIGSPGEAYLVGRGVDPSFAASCRVGYHPNWLGRGEAVMFLGFERDGTLACAQGRFLDPGAEPKTMSKGKISLASFVTPKAFERDSNPGPVAIVEAPIDAVLLAQHGLPAIATFGAQNHPAGLQKSIDGRDVVLALDDDEAGHKAAKWYRENLTPGTDTSTRLLFDGAKDPGDLWKQNPEKLSALVQEAVSKTQKIAILDYSTSVLGDASLLVPPTIVKPSLPSLPPPVLQKAQATPNSWHGVYGPQGEHVTREMVEESRSQAPDPPPKKEKERLAEDNCGECGALFTGKTAQESAEKLQSHIKNDPCEKYAALAAKANKQEETTNECTFRCGGCGLKYETRAEIEAHVALSQAKQAEMHYASKLNQKLGK